jgi:hypothetical protein
LGSKAGLYLLDKKPDGGPRRHVNFLSREVSQLSHQHVGRGGDVHEVLRCVLEKLEAETDVLGERARPCAILPYKAVPYPVQATKSSVSHC